MRWAAHVAGVEKRHVQRSGAEMSDRNHLEDPGVDGKIILKGILKT
jgi:hypothetical protein